MRIGFDKSDARGIGSQQTASICREIACWRRLGRALQEERGRVGTVDEQVRQRKNVVDAERSTDGRFSAAGGVPGKSDARCKIAKRRVIEKIAADSGCSVRKIDERGNFSVRFGNRRGAFVTQAKRQGEIGANAERILRVTSRYRAAQSATAVGAREIGGEVLRNVGQEILDRAVIPFAERNVCGIEVVVNAIKQESELKCVASANPDQVIRNLVRREMEVIGAGRTQAPGCRQVSCRKHTDGKAGKEAQALVRHQG